MIDNDRQFSIKRPRQWLWRTNYSLSQVHLKLEQKQIAGDWLICPHGEAEKAVTVDRFLSDPKLWEPSRSEDEQRSEAVTPSNMPSRETVMAISGLIALLNFLAPFMLATANYAMPVIVLSFICAQIGLLAAWGVFSSLSLGHSLSVTAVVGLLLYGCGATAVFVMSGFGVDVCLAILFGLMLCPSILFAMQTPLWAARVFGRAQIAKANEPPTGSYQQPTRLKDLFTGTAVLGVAMALVKTAPSVFPGNIQDSFYTAFGTFCGSAFVVSLVGIAPLMYFTFSARFTPRLFLGGVVWAAFAVTAMTTMIALLVPITIDLCLVAVGVFAATLCLGFLGVRSWGYRMRWSGLR